jgi:hypothetical protein
MFPYVPVRNEYVRKFNAGDYGVSYILVAHKCVNACRHIVTENTLLLTN